MESSIPIGYPRLSTLRVKDTVFALVWLLEEVVNSERTVDLRLMTTDRTRLRREAGTVLQSGAATVSESLWD